MNIGEQNPDGLAAEEGIWQKLRSSTVPSLYVVIGAAILVILIIFLAALLCVRGEKPQTEVVAVPIYVKCEDDWISYRGKCYYISDKIATWTDSQNFCKLHDSSLAIIDNEKEMNFLNLLKSNNLWIGLSRTQDDSDWVWTDGTFFSETTFDIHRKPTAPDDSEHVFLNGDGFKSDSGRYPKKWICSKSFLGHPP
ncbi:C-type lectin domain family 2 member F-like [Rana temporaria]|uniref:C-type lectin domain family 2 member F-like n=1 Tax=Rana temporaria TaxID=8407 RepID=UPI001AACDE8B|nr:C-type lectin domain family 2 member F-like [Rana temporaria]